MRPACRSDRVGVFRDGGCAACPRSGAPSAQYARLMSTAESPSRSRAARAGRGSVPTLHDVAREAGVSLATASRVLNGSDRKVAESFRERVERAAAELGYTANVSAQATARGTSGVTWLKWSSRTSAPGVYRSYRHASRSTCSTS